MLSLERFERKRDLFEEICKKKSDILFLKKKPSNKIEWPWHYSQYRYGKHTSNKSKKRPKTLYKKEFLEPPKALPKAPLYNITYSSPEVYSETSNEMDELVEEFISKDLKSVDKSKVESIQTLSLGLLDRMLASLADTRIPAPEASEVDLGWEYVMGNMLELGLPHSVIDRVKNRMEQTGIEPSPAITAMNVTRPVLSDLTITTAEVEMQQEIQKLVAQKELFEPKAGDEPFEDSVQWLIQLDRKDQELKDKEIENIHLDYTKLL